MFYKNLKINKNLKSYEKSNKKYSLVKLVSGIISPVIILTSLTSCFNDSNKYKNNKDDNYDYGYHNYYEQDNSYTSSEYNNSSNKYENSTESNYDNNKVDNPNLSLDLDDYSINIINSKVTFDQYSMDTFVNYIKNIEVSYPYSSLFRTDLTLDKYNSLNKYNGQTESFFKNNNISVDTLFSIVKKNNEEANLVQKATLSDSELKEICSIIVEVLNDYATKHPNANLNILSEKINNLKILKFDDFSNGYFDSTNGKMGFNVSKLKSKSYEFYKNTIQHETYHLIQANTIGEAEKLNFDNRYGISYKFNDVNVNSLSLPWYYEGSAEYLVCNLNNTKESSVYGSVINSMDTIKVATILSKNNNIDNFENISLSNDLNDLFDYFGCENKNDKIEVLNLMYAYNIIYDLNFCCDDFYEQYKTIYGEKAKKSVVGKQLKDSIGQTLTKQFYKNLSLQISNKEFKVEEIFSIISVFENELSRELFYNSNQDTLEKFFDVYTDVQSELFNIIANKLGISVDELQQIYNAYNSKVSVDVNRISILDYNEKNYYNYILNTRKNHKMNSINYVITKYNNKKQR